LDNINNVNQSMNNQCAGQLFTNYYYFRVELIRELLQAVAARGGSGGGGQLPQGASGTGRQMRVVKNFFFDDGTSEGACAIYKIRQLNVLE
jgi:hypothetical protein